MTDETAAKLAAVRELTKQPKLIRSREPQYEYMSLKIDQVDFLLRIIDDLTAERLDIARAYDPNCDYYVHADEVAKMQSARRIVESVQEMAVQFGRDPEGCLDDIADEALGEIAKLTAERDAALVQVAEENWQACVGRAEGAKEERERIVAWLRKRAAQADESFTNNNVDRHMHPSATATIDAMRSIADAIEADAAKGEG